MSASAIQILFVGDMHLGRRPSRLPAGLFADGTDAAAALGPGAAWGRIVDEALQRGVDAVALAGDVVDQDNALFEAAGQLDAGLQRLAEAGIPVAAVAGNHDLRTLPALARRGGFHLLGVDGTWSDLLLQRAGLPPVRLVGWSFPEAVHARSPLTPPPPAPRPDEVTLGLLHADLDQPGSSYAPVRSAELAAVGYAAWFLGHVHRADPVPADGSPFYLGSITGLDPGETGGHGPVLVSVGGDGRPTGRRLPLAPLRWERLDVPCDDLAAAAALNEHVLAAVESCARRLAPELGEGRALGLRLRLTGRHADPAALERTAVQVAEHVRPLSSDGVRVFVEKIECAVRAALDLTALARRDDPAGRLARRLLVLDAEAATVPGVDDPAAERRQLLAAARARLTTVDGRAEYALLAESPLDDATVGRLAAAAASGLLDRLLAARRDGRAPDPA